MSWRALAGKDVRDAARSRTAWLLTALSLLVYGGIAVYQGSVGEPTLASLVGTLSAAVVRVVPALGLLVGYKSIADERADGSLLLTLSMPHSRRDLAVGKFVGRTVVLLAPTLGALLVAGAIGVGKFGTDGLASFPWFLLVAALYGTVFVAVGVGISMTTTDDRRLTLGAIGAYVFLVNLYGGVHSAVLVFLHRGRFQVLSNLPDWALLYRLFQPSEAYYRLLHLGFDAAPAARYLAGGAPFYVDWWMALVVLAVYCVGALGIGYRRFSAGDL
ncbi:ABC transporter permease [Halostella salina]|uniref:ABC transporter permease n=1 Tax=Halostella salina TaxID=1547897 RepID=UPI000EF7B70C|nr:ABC transporter permease subunit [Halostella salina]